MVAGDLSTQCFNRDEYLSLITAGSPAQDDDSGRQQTVIPGRNQLTKTLPRTPSFRPKRRGVEKSHTEVRRPMVAGRILS